MPYVRLGIAALVCGAWACSSSTGDTLCTPTPYTLGTYQGTFTPGQNASSSSPLGCQLYGLPATVLGFTPPSTAGLDIQAVGESATPALTLADGSGRYIDSTAGTGHDKLLLFPSIMPFQLIITPFSLDEATDGYTVTVSPLTQGGCTFTATPLLLSGSQVESTITSTSCPTASTLRTEWFSLYAGAGQTLTVTLSSPTSPSPVAAVLWNVGQLPAAVAQSATDGTLMYSVPSSSGYQVEVTAQSTATPAPYTMRVALQ